MCAGVWEASPYGGLTFRRALRGAGKVLTAVGGGGREQWWVCREQLHTVWLGREVPAGGARAGGEEGGGL